MVAYPWPPIKDEKAIACTAEVELQICRRSGQRTSENEEARISVREIN